MLRERVGGSEFPRRKKPDPDSFWSNTPDNENNPTLVVARLLVEKGVRIYILEAFDREGRKMDDYVSIHTLTPREKLVLNQLLYEPEVNALLSAYIGFEPHLDDCSWDDQTKNQVRSFRTYPHNALSGSEIQELLEPVVDRVLAQVRQTS